MFDVCEKGFFMKRSAAILILFVCFFITIPPLLFLSSSRQETQVSTVVKSGVPAKAVPITVGVILVNAADSYGWAGGDYAETDINGSRVIVFDNRGHGRSEKLHDPAAYSPWIMAADAVNLLDHLGIARADVMGYSMGARIAAHMAAASPERVRGLVLAGLGIHLVDGEGLPAGIADAMEAPSADGLTDPMQRMFRVFAEATKSDLGALAACMRGSRHALSADVVGTIATPTLTCVGSEDDVAGDPEPLAQALLSLESANAARPMEHAGPATAHLYIVNPLHGRAFASLLSTHPPVEERVKRLREMRRGVRYA